MLDSSGSLKIFDMGLSLRRDVSATVDLRHVLGSLVMLCNDRLCGTCCTWYGGFPGADQIEDFVTLSICIMILPTNAMHI